MKRQTIKSLVASLAVAVCGIPAGAIAGPSGSAKGNDCHAIAAGLRKAVAANPSQVLVLVEDTMIANGACACEIVKAGILGAGADAGTEEANALVKQIVYAAITVNPSMSSVIVECAMAVAPKASAEIQAALGEALGGSKGGGVAQVEDFGPAPGIRGIYLVPPVASGAAVIRGDFDEDGGGRTRRTTTTTVTETEVVEIIREVERETISRPPSLPRPPVSPSSAY